MAGGELEYKTLQIMFNLKTGGFALIRMEEALPYRTCQDVNSIHVVLGELIFCFPPNTCVVQKALSGSMCG